MSVVKQPYTLQERYEHAIAALSAIVLRGESIPVPNGTTKVFMRIAYAGIDGTSIEEAGARAAPEI